MKKKLKVVVLMSIIIVSMVSCTSTSQKIDNDIEITPCLLYTSPIRVVDTVNTAKLNRINDTTYVFDFGRNIAGITSLKVRGESGTIIRLKHGERIYPNGLVDVSNIDVYCQPVVLSDPLHHLIL